MPKSNREIVAELRSMLTQWFPAEHLEATKQWRGHMWKLLNEVESHMCPVDYRAKLLAKEAEANASSDDEGKAT